MIKIDIPGHKAIEANHLVLDYNGTLAIDGKLIEGVKPLLELLSHQVTIHVITADTFGSSKDELSGINCMLHILEPASQDVQKRAYLKALGKKSVIAIGNGMNDKLMLKQAALGIGVIQKEGALVNCLTNADIVCYNIIEALDLLLNLKRLTATMRI